MTMKTANLLRLYSPHLLTDNLILPLDEDQKKHLVSRRKPESCIFFNEESGSFLAHINKNQAKISHKIESSWATPFKQLCVCSPKPKALALICEKGTELGVTSFVFMSSDHTQISAPNMSRLSRICLDAAQQCERFTIPSLQLADNLQSFLKGLSIHTLVCLERQPQTEEALPPQAHNILVGPEGGFSSSEKEAILNHPLCHPISLGKAILRSETAALAMCAKF